MQAALRAVNNDGATRAAKPELSTRALTIRAIHATWRKVAPRGLEAEELRDARLAFCSKALGLRKPLTSIKRLSPAQLGRVIDAMRELERSPALPGVAVGAGLVPARERAGTRPAPTNEGGEIVHLASAPQVEAIGKLFAFLNWSPEGRSAFIQSKFKKSSERMLLFREATSLTMILLTIAATRDIKDRTGAERVGRKMVMAVIPDLKRRLGIDQKPSADFTDYAEGEVDD